MKLTYELLSVEKLDKIHTLETKCFPPKEAASKESILLRLREAGEYFLGCYKEKELVGFINATRFDEFEEESMSFHDPDGKILGIHSVLVDEKHRRQGIATQMLKVYLQLVYNNNKNLDSKIEDVALLTKPHNVSLYLNVGFICNKVSPIQHGGELWLDCSFSLAPEKVRKTFLNQALMTPEIGISYRNEEYATKNADIANFFIVSAFTAEADERKYLGNQAAVVLCFDSLKNPIRYEDHDRMMSIAAEFGYSETAFVFETADIGKFRIKYFTPASLVEFCGHATLATAKVLFQVLEFRHLSEIVFELIDGRVLSAAKVDKKILLVFPVNKVLEYSDEQHQKVLNTVCHGFGIEPQEVETIKFSEDSFFTLVEVDISVFSKLTERKINFDSFLGDEVQQVVTICCRKSTGFLSRTFGPKVGIPEDPVTGSAHAMLFPYFSTSQNEGRDVVAVQDSPRGGKMTGSVVGDNVQILADAKIFGSGKLF
eukprot:snap_masked-scaffold_36-processed-gene-2.97-mRNA-1 protein AED:0.13 eAED:0.14 QI:0/-1/0/1/-1/1/1/0/484